MSSHLSTAANGYKGCYKYPSGSHISARGKSLKACKEFCQTITKPTKYLGQGNKPPGHSEEVECECMKQLDLPERSSGCQCDKLFIGPNHDCVYEAAKAPQTYGQKPAKPGRRLLTTPGVASQHTKLHLLPTSGKHSGRPNIRKPTAKSTRPASADDNETLGEWARR